MTSKATDIHCRGNGNANLPLCDADTRRNLRISYYGSGVTCNDCLKLRPGYDNRCRYCKEPNSAYHKCA